MFNLMFLADGSSETYNTHSCRDGMLSGLLEETVLFLLKAEVFFYVQTRSQFTQHSELTMKEMFKAYWNSIKFQDVR